MDRQNHEKRMNLYAKALDRRNDAFKSWSEHSAISHAGNGTTCPTCHFLARNLEEAHQTVLSQEKK
jgi:hypothetical protein